MSFGIVAGALATGLGASATTAAIVGAGASALGSGLLQSDAASSAADAQSAATGQSIAEQKRQFDLTRSDYAPYRDVGQNALQELARYLGLPSTSGGTSGTASGRTLDQIKAGIAGNYTTGGTPDAYHQLTGRLIPGTAGTVNQAALDAEAQRQFAAQPQATARTPGTTQQALTDNIDPTQDPGYMFGLRQGQEAIDRKIAAGGGRVSGAAIKAAGQYATDYATTGYSAAYQRRQDRLARLQSLAGIGQSATSGTANAGAGTANALSTLYGNQGDASGAASMAQGNIWSNAINQGVAGFQRNNTANVNPYLPSNSNYGLPAGPGPNGTW